jgi:hypothetical protein
VSIGKKRVRLDWQDIAFRAVRKLTAQRELILALADRIHAAHEALGRLAERRAVVLTERDYCPLAGEW